MVQITFLEVHLDDASFSAAAPFSGSTAEDATSATDGETNTGDETDDAAALGTEDSGPPKKAVAAIAGLVGLVVIAALVRYLRGGDEPDVDIETADDGDRPVSVTVSDE